MTAACADIVNETSPATLLTALSHRHPVTSYPRCVPLPVIEVAFLNGQENFLFACHGACYSTAVSAVTGEVVLPLSVAWCLLTFLGGTSNSRHRRQTAPTKQ